jgi:hypothetical protein
MTERRPPLVKQHDLTRALRAAGAAGLTVTRVEIDPQTGRIIIGTGAGEIVSGNDLDKWLADNAHQA